MLYKRKHSGNQHALFMINTDYKHKESDFKVVLGPNMDLKSMTNIFSNVELTGGVRWKTNSL